MGSYRSPGSDPRMEEKADMIVLNNKLAGYVQKVRQLGASGPESALFLETLRNIEDEVNKLKAMYERELEKYRQKLDEANRQKNEAISENAKNKRAAADFQDRYRAECDKNNRMREDLNKLQQKIADLERELTTAKSQAKAPQAQLQQTQADLYREQKKNQDLNRELDQEKGKNKQLEDQLKGLNQKQDFNGKVKDEQLRDANAHLEQAKRLLANEQSKNQELERQIPKMMDELRRKTDKELQDYKNDMEAANKQKDEAMRRQIDEQNRSIDRLKSDIAKLEKENQDLNTKIRALEGQVQDLKSQKAALEDQVQKERQKSADQIRALERKLKELQEMLLAKMQEVNASRETQVSLRNEIEAMRVLLEEEERRLGGKGLGCGTRGSSGYASPGSPYGTGRVGSGTGRKNSANGTKNGKTGYGTLGGTGGTGGRTGGGKTTRKPGPETEYQDAYNGRSTFRRCHYGDEGLGNSTDWAQTNRGGRSPTGRAYVRMA